MVDIAKAAESSKALNEEEENLRIPSPDRPFYIDLELGFRIYVDKKTYNLYKRPREAEAKKEERRSRCIINGKRCLKDCSTCSYSRSGYPISLERQYEKFGLEYADQSESIVDRLAREELIDALYREIGQLSEDDRKIALLIREGISSHEIARRLGLPQRTVYDRMKKILSNLREKLEPYR